MTERMCDCDHEMYRHSGSKRNIPKGEIITFSWCETIGCWCKNFKEVFADV